MENAGIFDERALDGSLCLNYSGDLQKSSEISKIFSYIQVSNKNISYSIKIKSNAMCSEKKLADDNPISVMTLVTIGGL